MTSRSVRVSFSDSGARMDGIPAGTFGGMLGIGSHKGGCGRGFELRGCAQKRTLHFGIDSHPPFPRAVARQSFRRRRTTTTAIASPPIATPIARRMNSTQGNPAAGLGAANKVHVPFEYV